MSFFRNKNQIKLAFPIILALVTLAGLAEQRSQKNSSSESVVPPSAAAAPHSEMGKIAGKSPGTLARNDDEDSKDPSLDREPPHILDADDRQDIYANIPSIESLVDEYLDLSEEELRDRLVQLTKDLESSHWIERANQDLLTSDERATLARLLQEDSALRLAALQHKLNRMEKNYL